jgi:hypothetical protein
MQNIVDNTALYLEKSHMNLKKVDFSYTHYAKLHVLNLIGTNRFHCG